CLGGGVRSFLTARVRVVRGSGAKRLAAWVIGSGLILVGCARDHDTRAFATLAVRIASASHVESESTEPLSARKVRAAAIIGDTVEFGAISQLRAIGDRLVAIDRLASPHLIVMDKHTGRTLARTGRHGAGPAELRNP